MYIISRFLLVVGVCIPFLIFSQHSHIEPMVGLSHSTSGFSQVWVSVGPDAYFIYELGTKITSPDRSTYYPTFDHSTIKPWNDRYTGDVSRFLIWGVSSGYHLPRINLGLHAGVNVGFENVRYVYYDETHSLYVNGLYSFPKEVRGILLWRLGTLYQYKSHMIYRLDIDLGRSGLGNVWMGMGYKF